MLIFPNLILQNLLKTLLLIFGSSMTRSSRPEVFCEKERLQLY